MAPRRRCPVCRSKQWHKEPSSGLIACSEGHILQNYRNETTEAEDLGQHALKKRNLKSTRKKKEKKSQANPKLYHGPRARYLYFQCQQLILRKQIAALMKLCGLPPEFEMVCRDIWALHLSLLPDPPPAEPYYHAQRDVHADTEHANEASKNRTSPIPDNVDRPPSPGSSSSDDEDDKDRKSSGAGQEEEDPEMAELLRQNSESEGEDENEDGQTAQNAVPGMARRRTRVAYEGPANNLAVLMLACWTMRVPILYRDFARYAEHYELPYLDPVRYLPSEIVVHLTKHNIQALSPAHVPNTVTLHALTSRLARVLYVNYGILTPEANAAPVLWRVVDSLGGAPMLYCLAKRLSHILALTLTLHHSLAPSLRIVNTRDPENHKYDDVPVEVSFMATTIVALKMMYGLDGTTRCPQETTDPACVLPKLDEFLKFVGQLNEASKTQEATIFSSVHPTSVGELRDELIDDYLSFCEKALLNPDGSDRHEDTVLTNHFTLTRTHGKSRPETHLTRPRFDATPLCTSAEGSDEQSPSRPAESYVIYHARDVFGSLPEEMEVVIERGSRWTGVSEEYLGGVIEKYERRVVRWWKEREKHGKQMEG